MTLARQERWESKACQVSQVPSVQWESRVPSGLRVSLALLAFVASREKLALLACVVPLERLGRLVPSVCVARLALPASRVRWVPQV